MSQLAAVSIHFNAVKKHSNMSLSSYLCKRFLPIFYCLLGMTSSAVFAGQINNVYSASVPVVSQQLRDRSAGFDAAFIQVLVKASGQYDRIVQGDIATSWLPAEPYVQTFSYRENPVYLNYLEKKQQNELAEIETETKTTDGAEALSDKILTESDPSLPDSPPIEIPPLPYLLDVSFAASLVQEKMSSFGIPVWGSTRPSTLVWVVIESEGERSIIGTSDEKGFVETILAKGEQRGVPLFLPVADLQDVSTVNVDDLWGLYTDSVDLASERYPADAVVMMRVYQSGEQLWSGNWVIKLKQELATGSFFDSQLDILIESLVTDIADTLSSHYAVLKVPAYVGNSLDIEVSQINSFENYIGLQRYLNALPPVSSAYLKWVGRGRAAYHLVLRGPHTQFLEHVELGGRLQPDVPARPQNLLEEKTAGDVKDENEKIDLSQIEVSLTPWLNSSAHYFSWSADR